MKKNIFVILMIGIFTSQLFCNNPLEVPSQYETIGDAIIAAELLSGSVAIEVSAGTYEENLWINLYINGLRNLSLIGVDGAGTCIIDGGGSGDVINVTGDENTTLTISGFTITESGDNSNDKGIDLLNVNLYLDNCIIESCKFGIYAQSTAYVQCTDNEFYNEDNSNMIIETYRVAELLIEENLFENYGSAANNAITLMGTTGNICDNEFIDFGDAINLWYLGNYPNKDLNISRNLFNVIDNAGVTINIQTCENLKISNNIFQSEVADCDAISFPATNYNYGNIALIEENVFENFNRSIYLQGHTYTHIYQIVDLINNTFCNSQQTALYLSHSNSLRYCKNNIFYNNEADLVTSLLSTDQTPSFSYNLFEENIFATNPSTWNGGNNQIGMNPNFVDPTHGNYNLLGNSFCIDHADPDTDDDDILWQYDPDDRDVDGTRMDIGCFPYLHEYDTKIFTKGVHWISFPILTQQGTFNDELFEKAYFENTESGLFQSTFGGDPTITSFEKIDGKDKYITYNFELGFDDNNFDNMLFRYEGYKVSIGSVVEPTVLTIGNDQNERLPVDHSIDDTMVTGEYHWIGYWLLNTQDMDIAFGDFWDDVQVVKAEDWCYIDMNSNREEVSKIKPSMTIRPLEYGKAYLVKFKQNITDFHWFDSSITVEAEKKTESENFNFEEKTDYEVIDVVDIPANVSEIGVFEDEACVGAVVVEGSSEQILIYSDNANRDQVPFSFEVITDSRSISNPVLSYQVFNETLGEFEYGNIISGNQEYSLVIFNKFGEPDDDLPVIDKIQLHNNYPNPFNPETNISFSIPAEQKVELTIYNLKGQKVRQLVNGQLASGKHSIVWEGKDNNGKLVGSGLYFYKLRTDNKEISKKMLLLK
jgi:FlgD Ig-like domain/Right handed beta helix region